MEADLPDHVPSDPLLAEINLEIDFQDQGGLQRFRTVGDFDQWLSLETQFWKFLREDPGRKHAQTFGTLQTMLRFEDELQQQLEEFRPQWIARVTQIENDRLVVENPNATEPERTAAVERIAGFRRKLEGQMVGLRDSVHSKLMEHVVHGRTRLLSSEPAAQFLVSYAVEHPAEAAYALDQILFTEQKSNDQRIVESRGRTRAVLFLEGIKRRAVYDAKAFQNTIKTWDRELVDFKGRFEAQEEKFGQLTSDVSAEQLRIEEYMASTRGQFADLDAVQRNAAQEALEAAAKELKSLTSTYDEHMALKAPAAYWRGKHRLHARKTTGMRNWVIGASLAAGAAIWLSAYMVLPEHHPSGEIPWRRLGIFLLVSTFALSFVRLTIKLMLSNLHLAADAEERTIMIRTFMALLRRSTPGEGLKKEDIAIVLAPIFKPSTSGIIRDDGGPTSMGEFLSHMTGGKGGS